MYLLYLLWNGLLANLWGEKCSSLHIKISGPIKRRTEGMSADMTVDIGEEWITVSYLSIHHPADVFVKVGHRFSLMSRAARWAAGSQGELWCPRERLCRKSWSWMKNNTIKCFLMQFKDRLQQRRGLYRETLRGTEPQNLRWDSKMARR